MYIVAFVLMWYQKVHNLKKILKEYWFEQLTTSAGNKDQPVTSSVDEIAAGNYSEPHHYQNTPLYIFFIDICLYLY